MGKGYSSTESRRESRSHVVLSALLPQTMTDVVGNPEEERRAEFYFQPWAQEAVCRYFYSKVSAVPEHTREVTQGRISGVGCQPLVSRACIPVFSAGAAEAAGVRASPGNPKHIGPLRP